MRGERGFGVLSITVAFCRTRECAAMACLSVFVALCRSKVRARLWCFCR